MSLHDRIDRLTPEQRHSVDVLVSLLELSEAVPSDVDEDDNRLRDLYYKTLLNENDLVESRRIMQYGVSCALRGLAQNPQDSEARSRLFHWQLCAADLDMSFYFWTCDQAYRRSAVTRYKELARILDKEPQTYHVRRAVDHTLTMARRLETIPHYVRRDEPTPPEDAYHLHEYWAPFTLTP